jgi:HSP20 family protein
MFPAWTNDGLKSCLGSDDYFNSDFFEEDSLMPAMNVKETEKDFEIEFAAPGFEKKDFEVTVNNNVLNVSGKKQTQEEEKEDDYSRKEFSYNSFKRSLSLPKYVNADQEIKAIYKDGILKLNLKKKEAPKVEPKKVIEVH